jgi:hypothetical protein
VDQIKDMFDQLADLADDQVTELQNKIIKEFESVEKEDPTPQSVDAMSSLADMLDTVRGEFKRREAAVQELAQRAAEASARVYGEGEKDMESDSEEKKAEEMTSESEAAMAEDKKEEEAPVAEAPVAEAPAAEEMPAEEAPTPEMEEEEKEEEEKMSEASIDADKTVELSTESTETIVTEAAAAVEATAVVADGAEDASAEETAPVEAADAAEAVVAEAEAAVEDAAVVAESEAAVAEVTEDAEASNQTTTEPTEVQEKMEAPVTAAADNADNLNIEVPADRRPVAQASVAPVAITAGADIPGYTAGSSMNDMHDVASAFEKRIHALRRVNGGDGEQHIVASIATQYPEERVLTTDAESNWAKIQAVTGPEALVASGGHSTPFEVKYDIFGLGTTARPLKDALPKFQADRGGIRFVTPPVLSSYANAVGIWTAANDSAETPSPASKLSLTVSAATENTVATDAVTLQLQFGNLMTRAYPELIARHNELGLIQHAREAEGQILTRLTALSTAVTSTSLIGVARDFLVQLGRAAANYRGRHRLEADAPLRVIAPAWIKDAMVADLALAAPGDSTLNAAAEIDGYIASRNINITYHIDDFTDAQGASAMNEFSDTFVWYMFAEGTFLFLDGGTLDLGVIRDSTLVGTNDYKMFVETFEGVAKVGVESLKVTSTISVNGVAAALRDTTGGATAAVIEY